MSDREIKYFRNHKDETTIFSEEIQKYLNKVRNVIRETPGKQQDSVELPEYGCSLSSYWEILLEKILPYTVNVNHPKFIGHMTSEIPNFLKELSVLVTHLNQNVVKEETSQIITHIERKCIAILHKEIFQCAPHFYEEFLDAPNIAIGSIVSNGSLANAMAMWVAFSSALNSPNKTFSEYGITECLFEKGYSGSAIICSSLAHYSVEKLASLMGLGRRNVIRIPVDNDGRMSLIHLHNKIKECQKKNICILSLWGIAGSTELGSIDHLSQIGTIAKENDIHFHVDAAWGGIFVLDQLSALLKGIKQADSVTICGHKQFYLPMGISAVLFRKSTSMNLIETRAQYQARQDSFDLGRWSIEGSRPASSLYLHAALYCIGRNGYKELMNHSLKITQYFKDKINSLDCFELVQEPQMNIVSYRYIPVDLRSKQPIDFTDDEHTAVNELNKDLQQQQWQDGKSFVSRTIVNLPKYKNRCTTILRVVLINPCTQTHHIDEVIQEQIQIASNIEKQYQDQLVELGRAIN